MTPHLLHTQRLLQLCSLFLMGLLSAEPVNIIFILTDDLGYGELGVFHQNSRNFADNRDKPAFSTPNLDRMALEGIRMERHYCAAPVCVPSRASFLTGMHQGHTQIRDNEFDKTLEDRTSVADVLREAGYATAVIGKWGVGGPQADGYPGHPLNRGFDYFFGILAHTDAHYHYPKEFNRPFHENFSDIRQQLDKCYSTDLFTARAKAWIANQTATEPGRPFFLYLNYTAPHAREELPTMAYPPGGVQWLGTPGQMINTATGSIDQWIHPDYANATWDHDQNSATAETPWPAVAKRHATMIRRLDDAMGDILQFLSDQGLDENTLVVFTSDNGPHNAVGDNGLPSLTQDPRFFRSYGNFDGIKRDMTEGGLRVPTLARWPGTIPAGRVSTHPSQFHDWLPTFAVAAGVPPPARSDGVSLLPDLTGSGTQTGGIVYSEYTAADFPNVPNYTDFAADRRGALRGHQQALYLDGFKALRSNVQNANAAFQLFDTLADPGERNNRAGQPGLPTQADILNRILRLRRSHTTARVYDTLAVPALPAGWHPSPRVDLFHGDFAWAPRPQSPPDSSGLLAAVPVILLPAGQPGAQHFRGTLQVPQTGDYSFFVRTDLGAIARLHDLLLLDADHGVSGQWISSGTLQLEAGSHPFELISRHGAAGAVLDVEWQGPGFARRSVAAQDFDFGEQPNLGPSLQLDAPGQPLDLPAGMGLVLRGSVTDDAHPDHPTVSLAWEVLEAPPNGNVLFEPANALPVSIRFDRAGVYRLRLDAGDGEFVDSSSLEVRVGLPAASPPVAPLLWYPFDDSAQDAAGENDGQVTGTPAWVEGRRNGALRFAAPGRVDTQAALPFPGTTAWSASLWFFLELTPGVNGRALLQQLDGPLPNGRTWLNVTQNLQLSSFIGGIVTEGGNVKLNTWHHAALRIEDGAVVLFLDGQEVARADRAPEANTGAFRLGERKNLANGGAPWIGKLDEAAIYTRALSLSEIQAAAATPTAPGPHIALALPVEGVAGQPLHVSAVVNGGTPPAPGLLWSLQAGEGQMETPAAAETRLTPSASGPLRLRLEADNGSVTTFVEGEIQVLSSLLNWRRSQYGTLDNEGDAADLAMPDGDGIANLFKYAFGIPTGVAFPHAPASTGTPGLPWGSVQNGRPRIHHRRDTRLVDVAYQVEWSEDLVSGPWRMDLLKENVLPTENPAVEFVETYLDAAQVPDRVFLRVRLLF